MEYLLVLKPGSRETLSAIKQQLEEKTIDELITAYNRQVEIGIVGVYRQALYLATLRAEFRERTGQSPIILEQGMLLRITDSVKRSGNTLYYLNDKAVESN